MLAGLAGCGKTDLLHALAARGEQVLDLEGLASHRGSAFGGVGLPPQPSHDAFAAAVRARVAAADPARVLWVEDEGPFVGRVGVPPELVARLAQAPVIALQAPLEQRVARLVSTYGGSQVAGQESAGVDRLKELEVAIERSRNRIGAECAAQAAACVRAGDLGGAVRLLLPAYDTAYEHRAALHGRRVLGVCDAPAPTALVGRSG